MFDNLHLNGPTNLSSFMSVLLGGFAYMKALHDLEWCSSLIGLPIEVLLNNYSKQSVRVDLRKNEGFGSWTLHVMLEKCMCF